MYRLSPFISFILWTAALSIFVLTSDVRAQVPPAAPTRAVEVGIGLRFMPIGWFDLADESRRTGFRAYPAMGFAPFVDYRVARYFSAGFSPEITLNVIPNRAEYIVGEMLALTLRLQLHYTNQSRFEPYALATCGYSIIVRGGAESASGPLLGGTAGGRLRFANRHAVFGQIAYQKGFQTLDTGAYAPSFLITELGWQVSF